MTDTRISGAHVFPEDSGTGIDTDSDKGDYISAGEMGGQTLYYGESEFVYSGASISYSSSAGTANLSGGLVFLTYDGGADIIDSATGAYSRRWDERIIFAVLIPQITGLGLASGAVNDIWLYVDRTLGDGVYVRHGSNLSNPPDPAIKIGTIDTSVSDGNVTTVADQAPEGYFGALTAEEATVTTAPTADTDVVRKTELDAVESSVTHEKYTNSEARTAVLGTTTRTQTDVTADVTGRVVCDTVNNPITVTLPPPSNTMRVSVKCINSANVVTVATPGSQTIDDASSLTLRKTDGGTMQSAIIYSNEQTGNYWIE